MRQCTTPLATLSLTYALTHAQVSGSSPYTSESHEP